jgi:hypothetical protein
MASPTPTRELDAQLRKSIRDAQKSVRRLVSILAVLLFASLSVTVYLGYRDLTERARVDQDVLEITPQIIAQLTRIDQSQCGFYVPLVLAGQELTLKTGSKLGVQLVEGSRYAMDGLSCPYQLPAPTTVLLQLGRKFGIPITR